MKHLAAIGTITETGYKTMMPLVKRRVLNLSVMVRGLETLAIYLHEWECISPTDTAFQMGYETDMGFFGHVQQEPLTAKQFNNPVGP
jgi:hypothetical protein